MILEYAQVAFKLPSVLSPASDGLVRGRDLASSVRFGVGFESLRANLRLWEGGATHCVGSGSSEAATALLEAFVVAARTTAR
jgi:hypothetical protein